MSLSRMIQSLGVVCDIHGVAETIDAGGFPIRTYTLKQSNVECAIFPSSADEVVEGGRPRGKIFARGYLLPTVDITHTDRILFDDSDTGTVRTFEVTGSRRSLMLHQDNHMQKRIVDLVEIE
mgnify:FL=1|tara:strand:+ start:2992 stop:3357 length:366 start_codon:yes stop_codon:yes gene_type:complete